MLKEGEETNILTFSCRLCSLFPWNLKRSCEIRELAYGLNLISNVAILNQSQSSCSYPPSTQFTHTEYFELVPHSNMISFPRSPLPSGKPDCDWEMLQEEELEWQSWGGSRRRRTWAHFSSSKLLMEREPAGSNSDSSRNNHQGWERGYKKKLA